MNEDFAAAMRQAALSTRASNLTEATRVIQDALSGRTASRRSTDADITPPPVRSRPTPFTIDPGAEIVEPSTKAVTSSARSDGTEPPQRLRKPLAETLRVLREGRLAAGAFPSLPGMSLPGMAKHSELIVPEGAQFLTRSFTCAAGTRSYKLYVPASAPDRPRGLVVMLHGCKQNPEDFAAGTGMNAVAEAHGLMVAYPAQTGKDNASSCWNWFRPGDQMRGAGEPSIIAGITEEITAEFGLDRTRVFIAGLSAGGAMAAVMGEAYPDLYAAVGVHSGLACGSANDVMSAFSVMRGDAGLPDRDRPRAAAGATFRVRTIVFQGSADRTVHPSNAERIVAVAVPAGAAATLRHEAANTAGGRTSKRRILADPDGTPVVEYWLVDGAGHAWSGGQAGGSYTDPNGPDASREMVRFFLNRPD